jgi:hypothetical protein
MQEGMKQGDEIAILINQGLIHVDKTGSQMKCRLMILMQGNETGTQRRPEFVVESGIEFDTHPLQINATSKLTITWNLLWNPAWKLIHTLCK